MQNSQLSMLVAAADCKEMDSFSGISLRDIANLSPEQIAALELQLAGEFKTTSKSFLSARLARISHILSLVHNAIEYISKQEIQWAHKQSLELLRIKSLKTDTADSALRQSEENEPPQYTDVDNELQQVIENRILPLLYDVILSNAAVPELPFSKEFHKIITPIRAEIDALDQDNLYQERLIRSMTEKDVEILWLQYYSDLRDHKNKLINETYEHLSDLDKEYHDLVPNLVRNELMDQYHKSVVPVTSLKRHHDELVSKEELANPAFMPEEPSPYNYDTHYSVQSRYIRNNRIEMTNARKEALKRLYISKYAYGRSLSSNQFLLSESEVDDDIAIIRKKLKSSEDTPLEEHVYETLAINEHTPVPEVSLEEKYKQLLNLELKTQVPISQSETSQNSDSSRIGYHASPPTSQFSESPSGKLVMPNIPPLEWFKSKNNQEIRFRPPVTVHGQAN